MARTHGKFRQQQAVAPAGEPAPRPEPAVGACGGCAYWLELPDSGMGQCRRDPPRVPRGTRLGLPVLAHGLTPPDYGCGEYRPRP